VTAKPGRTINQVVEHIYNPNNKNMCAKQTAEDRVRELIGNRLIDNQSRERGFHSLHMNNKNEYNLLEKKVSELYQMAENLDAKIKEFNLSPEYLSMKNKSRGQYSKFSLHVSNIIQLTQLTRYNMMAEIANEIQGKIKSNDSREALYLQLGHVLALMSKSQTPIWGMAMEGYTGYTAFLERSRRKSNKELTTVLNSFIKWWIYGTEEDQRKLKDEIRRKTGLNLT
jgi:hypothetical protein